MAGPQLLFPPLYPMLIRTGLCFTHSPAASARAVSIATGTLLVPLLFLIVSAAYERRTAWIAAVIGGLHTILIGFSVSTYPDCLYTTLLAGVVYFAISSLRLLRIRWFIALGSLLGLAYLTKPEIMGQIAVLLVRISAVRAWKHRLTYTLSGAVIVLVCFAVFASPYVAYLARYTHHLRLEGKSEVNYVMISGINAGIDPDRAANGLSDTEEEEGPLLNPNALIGRSTYPHSLSEITRFFFVAVSRNARGLYDWLMPGFWPPLLTLCLLGLFRSVWSQERALVELVLLSMFAAACIPMLIVAYLSWRYVLPVMPFVVIWAAKGIDELGEWVQQTLDNLHLQRTITELLTRPVGRPSHKPVVRFKSFLYQAASWTMARRVVAKVEFHCGELFPRVEFIVTNLGTSSRAVVRFYNKRHGRAVDQGRQAGGRDDTAFLPPLSRQRGQAVAESDRL